MDNVGKINADTTRNYYLKDHLGSIRVVLNSTNTVISAQDYDAWGYVLENRSYNSAAMKYDFTGKERDNETNYDYFGARYYDSRIGRWGGVDPQSDRTPGWTPYRAFFDNPINMIDPDGKVELPIDLIKRYPKLANYLENDLPKIAENKKIMNSLKKHTGLSIKKIKEGLEWGKGPVVGVENLGKNEAGFERYGMTVVGEKDFTISQELVENYINSKGEESDVYAFLIGVTVLHEGVHTAPAYGGGINDYSDIYDKEELGASFEFDAYGRVIYNYNDAVEVLNSRKGRTKKYSFQYETEEIEVKP